MSARASTSRGWIRSWAYTRLTARQICPLLPNALQKRLARDRVDIDITENHGGIVTAQLKRDALESSAAPSATLRPVAVEPVKLTLRGTGWDTMLTPSGSGPVTTLKTPSGSAPRSTRPSSRVASGVNGDGFSTMVFPARSAGAIFHIPSADRVVPRSDRADHAERSAKYLFEAIGVIADDLARQLEVCVVTEPNRGSHDLALGVGQRLALFRRKQGARVPTAPSTASAARRSVSRRTPSSVFQS